MYATAILDILIMEEGIVNFVIHLVSIVPWIKIIVQLVIQDFM